MGIYYSPVWEILSAANLLDAPGSSTNVRPVTTAAPVTPAPAAVAPPAPPATSATPPPAPPAPVPPTPAPTPAVTPATSNTWQAVPSGTAASRNNFTNANRNNLGARDSSGHVSGNAW